MWGLPKKYFKWKEPKEFRRTLELIDAEQERWWHGPCLVLISALCLMGIWCLYKLNPNNQPLTLAEAVLVSLAGGFIFVYVIPWIRSLAPSCVVVFENKLFRTRGEYGQEWKFSAIASYGLHDCEGYHLLTIKLKKRTEVLIGVPPEIDVDRVVEFLASRGMIREVRGTESVDESERTQMS